MDQKNAFLGVLLKRFFNQFKSVTYHGVPIAEFVYRKVMSRWNLLPGQTIPADIQAEMNQFSDAKAYQAFDRPYNYQSHPDGVILMRSGFGDLAVSFLPPERMFLISPNQAEVDVIKLNRPDLTAHNIQNYHRENPAAVKKLYQQIAEVILGHRDDPFLGTPDFLEWFKLITPEIVQILDAVQQLFDEIKVGAVLTVGSTYSMDGALNLIARANQVPSFTFQHGLLAECDLYAHIPIIATKKLVWGNAFLEWYRKFGFPESRIAAIGSPRFDIVFNRKWCGKEQLCKMLGIDPAQKIIVYATQIYRYTKEIAPIVLEALKNIPDLLVVMLLHPGEAPAPYKNLAQNYANCKVVQFGHISLYDALSGADLFITYYSTAALEAMFFKLPVVTVEPTAPTFSFGDLGVSIKVKDAAELKLAVQQLLSDSTLRSKAVEQYQNFLSNYCIPDGLASQRMFEEVERLCNSNGIA